MIRQSASEPTLNPAKSLRVGDIVEYLRTIAPITPETFPHEALEVGDLLSTVETILLVPFPSLRALSAAVSHPHPLVISVFPLFSGDVRNILRNDPNGYRVFFCIENKINLYRLDEGFFTVQDGFDDSLAKSLGLNAYEPLCPEAMERLCKYVVFVPVEAAEQVMLAASKTGAGRIGNYTQCSFQTVGKGTFLPGKEAIPSIGEVGSLEYVEEMKIEMVVQETRVSEVIDAVKKVHPYEEVACDILPLSNAGAVQGRGRIGPLPSKTALESILHIIRERHPRSVIRQSGESQASIFKVSITSGEGRGLYREAIRQRADVHITGLASVSDWALADGASTVLVEMGVKESLYDGLLSLKERLELKYPDVQIKVDF